MKFNRSTFGNLAGIGIAVYLAVFLIQTVKRNYDLQKQITQLQNQIISLGNEKDDLTYQIAYYKTDSFKEKEARAKLGLQAPGEGVIILPKAQPSVNAGQQAQKEVKSSNLRQWREFLFGS